MFRRRGRPGMLGAVARTAVVAGTATATANAVNKHSAQKNAEKEAYAEQQAQQDEPPAPQPQAPAPAAAPPADDLIGKINQLAQLRDAGVLSDDEFAAAKSKLLGI